MPVRKVSGGWQWGEHGKVYPTKEEAEEQEKAAYANGYGGDSYDMSSSVRSFDDYGRMDIAKCNISKECVSEYRGPVSPAGRRWDLTRIAPITSIARRKN